MIRPKNERVAFSIGALPVLTGVSVDNIRYYERINLLPAPSRTSGGQRRYTYEHVQGLVFIRRARVLGFPLKDIRSLLGLRARDGRQCEEAKSIALKHLGQLREKMRALAELEKELVVMTERCDPIRRPSCYILDSLQRPFSDTAGK
jgi:MerR family transcriptional regulator, mercuric resistance operon regulatory protein